MNNNFKKSGFTLIEVILAILIFSIGILAVFQVMTMNLSIIGKNRYEILAGNIAHESISLLFNVRDSNILRGWERDCIYTELDDSSVDDNFCSTKMRDMVDDGYLLLGLNHQGDVFIQTGLDTSVYFGTGDLKFVYNGSDKTKFKRYVRFSELNDGNNIIDSSKLLKVESMVIYDYGIGTGEFKIESIIGDI